MVAEMRLLRRQSPRLKPDPAGIPVFLRRRLDIVRVAEHAAEIEHVASQRVAYFYRNVHGPGIPCYPRAADNMIYAWPCSQHECIGHRAVLAKGLIAPPSRVWIVRATKIIAGTARASNEKGVCFPVVERHSCSAKWKPYPHSSHAALVHEMMENNLCSM